MDEDRINLTMTGPLVSNPSPPHRDSVELSPRKQHPFLWMRVRQVLLFTDDNYVIMSYKAKHWTASIDYKQLAIIYLDQHVETGGNRLKKKHTDLNVTMCTITPHFSSAALACCMKWHTGVALLWRCLIQREQTKASLHGNDDAESLCERVTYEFAQQLSLLSMRP